LHAILQQSSGRASGLTLDDKKSEKIQIEGVVTCKRKLQLLHLLKSLKSNILKTVQNRAERKKLCGCIIQVWNIQVAFIQLNRA